MDVQNDVRVDVQTDVQIDFQIDFQIGFMPHLPGKPIDLPPKHTYACRMRRVTWSGPPGYYYIYSQVYRRILSGSRAHEIETQTWKR